MGSPCRDGLKPRSIRCGPAELKAIRAQLAEGDLPVSRDEIEQLLLEAEARSVDGGYYAGLTYEDGVLATLKWLLGHAEQPLD